MGGNGFIGKNICNYLFTSGREVISFDRIIDNTCKCSHAVIGDYFNDEELFACVDEVDCIVHAICTISTNDSNTKFLQGYQKDLIQGVKLFEYAAKNGKKVIFLSSGGTVYGNPSHVPISENEATEPISHYGVLKRALENAANVINLTYGKHIISARLSNPYGPGQDFKKGIGFIDAVLRKASNHEEISIWGDGNIVRDYIYIDDVAKIIDKLVEYKGCETVFNVGTGIGTSQNQILETVRQIGLEVKVKYVESRAFDVKANILNIQRLKNIYHGKMIDVQEGIRLYYKYICGKTND